MRFLLYILSIFFFNTNCIVNAVGIEGRIAGGLDAASSRFPYSAAIYQTTSDGTYFCGGSLINNQWILTAGQCVANSTSFRIQLGSTKLTETDPNRELLATATFVLHPEYNPDTLENDIGLIKLRAAITFNDYIQPVTVSESDYNVNSPGISMGWGQTTDASADLSETLKFVYVAHISNEECANVFGHQIKESMLCMGGNYNQGFCSGDSGGPLVQHSVQQDVQIGIASFMSQNGCESTDPSGYTRTYFYLDWIKNVTETQ